MAGLQYKKLFLMVLILYNTLFLSGCYDMKEVDDRAFVLSYGVEKSKVSKVKLTIMIASPKKLVGGGQQGGGGGGDDDGLLVTTIDAPTLPIALNLMNTYVGRSLYFGHAGFAFYSEEFMKNGYATTLQSPQRFRELRKDLKLFVVRGGVAEFMKEIKPIIAANPTKYLRQITDSQETTGLIPISKMYKFYENVESYKVDPILPLCSISKKMKNSESKDVKDSWLIPINAGEIKREGGIPIEFLGTAVFKGNKMVDTLNGIETKLLNLIKGEFRSAIFAFPDINDPNNLESVIIKRGKTPEVKVDLSGKEPKIDVSISLDGDLMTTVGYTDYGNNDNLNKLEEKIEDILSTQSEILIKKMQKQNSDIFGFGYHVAKKFLTWQEYRDYKWLKEKYKVAKIDVKCSYHIRRIGLQGGAVKPGH